MAPDDRHDLASLSPDQAFAALGSGPAGLPLREAATRLARQGPNRLGTARATTAPLRLAWRQIESPLVMILVGAALVAAATDQFADAAIILSIVLLSTLIGFSQEWRAGRALDALRGRLALRVTVLRDGAPVLVDAETVVVGDVVMLAAGNLVPADGVVVKARDFLVSQAALTGESFPVEKRPDPSPPGTAPAARANMVFQGSSVRSGTAEVLVAVTGRATLFGAIAGRLRGAQGETDFERGLRGFGGLLMKITMGLVTLTFAANLALERPLIDSLLFSVALAVGLTPELLPAITSVTMAAGARRMARAGVIVRRLAAIEGLGAVDVLCTDKTGTLTEGVIALSAATDADGLPSDRVRGLALLNAALETGIANPLDQAILASAAGEAPPANLPKVDEIPYDFQRKRLTVVCDLPQQDAHLMVTKGAVDTVLAACSHVAWASGTEVLTDAVRARLDAYCQDRGREGFRMLAVASRQAPPKARYEREDETDLVLQGFLQFFDPLKPGIAETLAQLAGLGIAVKVITGDSRHVAAHVAAQVGLKGGLLTGVEIAAARDEALWHLAERADVFAEIDPQQKERLVRALQRRGHVVAYMGDGINDAPALLAADVGISVEGAVDVARDSADIVLLSRDLGSLCRGIVDGRRSFANTLKYIQITTSANFGNMISMAAAALWLPFLPLSAALILLNNFLSDIPALALAVDRVDADTLARAPRWDIAGIGRFMLVFGLVSTGFDLLTFALLTQVFHAGKAEFQTAWFLISLLTELAVVMVLRSHRPAWASAPGRLLWVLTLVILALALALPHAGPLAAPLGLVALPPALTWAALAIVVAYAAATEAAKAWYFGLGPAGHRAPFRPRGRGNA